MSFKTRSKFIKAQASEKITMAHVHATARLIVWTNEGGGIYSKTVPYFVTDIQLRNVKLNRVDDLGNVTANTYYYSPQLKKIYIRNASDENPDTVEMIVTYRFFYADSTLDASWNFENDSARVSYSGLILSSPGYKQKIGIDQGLTSLVGNGNLRLLNDGQFDNIFDTLYFENQLVYIYSWNRNLSFADSKLLFRGRITDKTFAPDQVEFKIKDNIFDLNQNIPQNVFTDSDNVSASVKGNYKRWVYGRVDGLQLQSIDQIADGYAIPGTVSIVANSTELNGTGTTFLSDLSPGDSVTIGTQEFTVESIASDVFAVLSDEPDFSQAGQTLFVNPAIPTTVKNREYIVADHACSELTTTVVSSPQLNRVELADTTGILVGDLLEFTSGERLEVKSFGIGNIVVLVKNLQATPAVGSTVIRRPIQKIFLESQLVRAADFTVNNGSQLTVTLDSNVEFNLAPVRSLNNSFTFTNGSRNISYTGESLEEILNSRDWIRPEAGDGTYYEILSVSESQIVIRTLFNEPTITDTAQYKAPAYISDTTIISADTLGRTEDGTPSGTWIKSAPQAIKDLLTQINITELDAVSFAEGENDSPQTISLAVPFRPGSSATTVKQAIDAVNETVLSSITTNNDLQIKYSSLFATVDDNIPVITDKEIVNWNVKSVTGKIYQNSIVRYRHQDINRATLQEGNSVVTFESDFVQNYIGTKVSSDLDAYLYDISDAQIRANREVYYNRLARTEVNIEGDLRLEVYEIGDSVTLDIARLYKRLGDSNTKQKIMKIVGKTVNGGRVNLILHDIANIYNASGKITPNTAADYSAATSEEKIKNGYITNNQGIVDNNEDTANINLIS